DAVLDSDPSEKDAVFDFARDRVPLPRARVADANRVNVRIVDQDALAAADTANDVAHLVEAHLVVTEPAHFRADALADCLDLRIIRGNGHNLAKEIDDA